MTHSNYTQHKVVPGDKRILDPSTFGLLGRQLRVIAQDPTVPINNNDQNTLIVPGVSSTEVGQTILRRDVANSNGKLNAENQYSPSMITLAIEATVLRFGDFAAGDDTIPTETMLQGVLKFGTGMANQGTQTKAETVFPSVVNAPPLDPRIIFDIAEGTMISIPAAYFQLDFLYTSVAADGFAANLKLGPDYQVVYSLAYEPQANAERVQMSQFAVARDLGTGGGALQIFARPKYATRVYFTWVEWVASNTLTVNFVNANQQVVWTVVYVPTPLTGPAELPWPADAVACSVVQSSGAPYTFFRCVSILDF